MKNDPPGRLVGTEEIRQMLGVSRSYAAQLVNTKGFPDPWVTIGKTRGWRVEDVEKWARDAGRELKEES